MTLKDRRRGKTKRGKKKLWGRRKRREAVHFVVPSVETHVAEGLWRLSALVELPPRSLCLCVPCLSLCGFHHAFSLTKVWQLSMDKPHHHTSELHLVAEMRQSSADLVHQEQQFPCVLCLIEAASDKPLTSRCYCFLWDPGSQCLKTDVIKILLTISCFALSKLGKTNKREYKSCCRSADVVFFIYCSDKRMQKVFFSVFRKKAKS